MNMTDRSSPVAITDRPVVPDRVSPILRTRSFPLCVFMSPDNHYS